MKKLLGFLLVLATAAAGAQSTGGSSGVKSINGARGSLTFNGSGVSQSGNTFTFSGTGGGVTGVSNSDGTLTISPTTGAVVASLNLAHANTWTLGQTYSAILTASAGMTMPSGQCLNWNSDSFISRLASNSLAAGATCGGATGNFTAGAFIGQVVETSTNGVNLVGSKAGIGSAGAYLFSSTAAGNGTPDSGFDRSAAGVIEANNGTIGNANGLFKAARLIPGVLYSVGGTPLPTCTSALSGQEAHVSDATSPTYMGAYAGSSTVVAAVICSTTDGTTFSWKTH